MILELVIGLSAIYSVFITILLAMVISKIKREEMLKEVMIQKIKQYEDEIARAKHPHLPTVQTKGSCGEGCGCH